MDRSSQYTPVYFAILLFLYTGGVALSAQLPIFKCTHLTTADGLSDNMVFCALQDRQGFMWFGTRDGLNRYDGYRFTVYKHNPKDSASLISNSIECLFEDQQGNLWIGGRGGLHRFNPKAGNFIRYTDTLWKSDEAIKRICDDRNGNIWLTILTPRPKLIKFDKKTRRFIHYKHDPNKPYSLDFLAGNIIGRDSLGNLWVGTDKGFNRYDEKLDGFINAPNTPGYGSLSGFSNFLVMGTSQDFWIGKVLDTFRIDKIIHAYYTHDSLYWQEFSSQDTASPANNSTLTVIPENNGTVWVATSDNGLCILDTATRCYTAVPQDNNTAYNIPSKRIFHLYKDRNQNIWIGTDAGIVKYHYQTRHFQHYGMATGLTYPNIRVIDKDADGNLYIGMERGGINKIINGKTTHIFSAHTTKQHMHANAINTATVNTLYRSGNNTFWLGTNSGVCILLPCSSTYKQQMREVVKYRVWSLFEDSKKDIWIGTLRNGMYRIDHTKHTVQPFFYSTDTNWITRDAGIGIFYFLESPKHTLWIGTTNGLYKMNTQTNAWKNYHYEIGDTSGLNSNDVWFIHQTHDGALWLATSGGGLNRFDPHTETFSHITDDDGLPSNIICAILEDNHGNLWVSTSKGLARYNLATKRIKTFGIGDGLYISEFHFKTCFKDTDGSMYFGGTGGYVHFHPDSIADNTTPPPMVFTGFKVFDKTMLFDTAMTHKSSVVLPYDKNFFTVEFAALDFANPAKNQYRYKLEGLDEQWRSTDGGKPWASYTSVPPGEYVLHVQGSNSDGTWNEEGIRLAIVITPAWWQTWWLKLSGLAFLGIMVALGLQWRYRSLKRRNEVEKKLVESQLQALRSQMNPHFIFNSLNSILHFITSNEQETAHVYLSKFSKLIRAILEQSRNEFIPLSEELYVLGLYLELEALRFDHRFTYSITVDGEIDVEEQQIPPMLLQPHVENAIKHGLIHTVSDGRLEVVIRRDGGYVVCSVIDNGIGRQRSQLLRGQSLSGHVSRGTSLTEDRLSILNNLHSAQYGVEIRDLTDGSGASRGTRVDVRIISTEMEKQ